MIAIFVYMLILFSIGTCTGWAYLVAFNFIKKRGYYQVSCIGLSVFFFGMAFINYDTFVIMHRDPLLPTLIGRLILNIIAFVSTLLFVWKSNFYNV